MGVEVTSQASMVEETNYDRAHRLEVIQKLKDSGKKGKELQPQT